MLNHKVLKNKKVDKDKALNLRMFTDGRGERLYVEFTTETPKLTLQKSFQNTVMGQVMAEKFSKSFKSVSDLKEHFGI